VELNKKLKIPVGEIILYVLFSPLLIPLVLLFLILKTIESFCMYLFNKKTFKETLIENYERYVYNLIYGKY